MGRQQLSEGGSPKGYCQRREQKQDEQQDCIIERENPQDAACVKGAEVVTSSFGIEKNAGDEKAGEYEEEVDADPATMQDADEQPVREGRLWGCVEAAEVKQQDGEDGDAADAIEFRDISGDPVCGSVSLLFGDGEYP